MNREVELLDFHINDLDDMNITYHEGITVDTYKNRFKELAHRGEAKLIKYKNQPIAAMGYYKIWQGVCELWVIPHEPIKDKGILALTLKHSLNVFILPQNFHRVQAIVIENDPSEEFLLKLNFKEEGVLVKYDIFKQNYKMWARVL